MLQNLKTGEMFNELSGKIDFFKGVGIYWLKSYRNRLYAVFAHFNLESGKRYLLSPQQLSITVSKRQQYTSVSFGV